MGLRINGSTSGYVELNAPAVAGSSSITIPTGNVTLASTAYVNNYAALPRTVFTQAASYSLDIADAGEIILMNVATANNLTIPLNSSMPFAIGTTIDIIQYGAGQTTIVATGGVTVNATPGLKLRARYSSCSLIKINTNEWIVIGDLSV